MPRLSDRFHAVATGPEGRRRLLTPAGPACFCGLLALVAAGPYRWVRNPMLTGLFAGLFGPGLALHSASMVFLTPDTLAT